MEETKFDTLGRIIYHVEPVIGTISKYEYHSNGSRVVTIINEKHKSNFKTIIIQDFINEEYIDKEVKEFGETYNITKKYEGKNKEVCYERFNIKTKKIFKRKTIWKEDRKFIWVTEYDGKHQGIGFRMTKELIEELINKNK